MDDPARKAQGNSNPRAAVPHELIEWQCSYTQEVRAVILGIIAALPSTPHCRKLTHQLTPWLCRGMSAMRLRKSKAPDTCGTMQGAQGIDGGTWQPNHIVTRSSKVAYLLQRMQALQKASEVSAQHHQVEICQLLQPRLQCDGQRQTPSKQA